MRLYIEYFYIFFHNAYVSFIYSHLKIMDFIQLILNNIFVNKQYSISEFQDINNLLLFYPNDNYCNFTVYFKKLEIQNG